MGKLAACFLCTSVSAHIVCAVCSFTVCFHSQSAAAALCSVDDHFGCDPFCWARVRQVTRQVKEVKEEKERETSTQFSTVPRGNIKLKTSTSISEEKEEERKSEKSKQGTYSCSNLHCLNEREIKQSLSRLALKTWHCQVVLFKCNH